MKMKLTSKQIENSYRRLSTVDLRNLAANIVMNIKDENIIAPMPTEIAEMLPDTDMYKLVDFCRRYRLYNRVKREKAMEIIETILFERQVLGIA